MVEVRDAATVMLVRDRPDLEVFMLRRSNQVVFGPGASVFPGGAVDPDDARVPILGRSHAEADALVTRPDALRWFAAAAREVFEESGFLLTTHDLTADAGAEVVAGHRAAVNAGARAFADVLTDHGTAVAADRMFLFSHWLTPEGSPRRYDTWFLAAAVPDGQEGVHDNSEAVHSEWVRPAEMLHRWSRDDVELIFPTMRTLQVLEQFESAAALLESLRAVDAEATANGTAPWVIDDASGERVAHSFDDPMSRRRGWRALTSAWERDAAAEAADRRARMARGA